jgi:hypothetical protein
MHILPQLRKLERKYADVLQVVGIHSAKFRAEQATEAVRDAILRYGIEHPVVNDSEFRVWQAYAVRAWPTLMFIDPAGKVIGKHEGEFSFEAFDGLLAEMVSAFEAVGLLDRRSLHFRPEQMPMAPLLFPGMVLADAAGDRFFIADSGHHRILVTDLAGTVQQVVGSGNAGLVDGPAGVAEFNAPQGMALYGDTLLVADTENHALRAISLEHWDVTTLAGTGEQGHERHPTGAGRTIALSSPWDLAVHGDRLFIAMAGTHQIWQLDLHSGNLRVFAGSGAENLLDGSLDDAQFAQPSGLALLGDTLYVADSEASGIRSIKLRGDQVTTVVGLGLFEFGDVDGTGDDVRLQHPLGLCALPGGLLIADTYNHRLKRLRPETRAVSAWSGSGVPGFHDGPAPDAQFREPSGVSVAHGKVYVADTNNHVVRMVDGETGAVGTLAVTGADFSS